jgi:hypothetical protein
MFDSTFPILLEAFRKAIDYMNQLLDVYPSRPKMGQLIQHKHTINHQL